MKTYCYCNTFQGKRKGINVLFIKRDFREKQLPNAAVKNKLRTGKREGILGSRNKGDKT